MASVLIWLGTIVLFLLGLLGVVVPGLPGVALVFAGVLLYAVASDFTSISGSTVMVLGVVALIAYLVEYAGGLLGAKIGGGGRYTMLGIVLGAILGLIIGGPPGLVVGTVAGAMLGALTEGKTPAQAGRAAIYSVLGIVGAKLVQFVLAIAIIISFLVAILT